MPNTLPPRPDGSPTIRSMGPALIVDAALPAIAYQVLTRYGMSQVGALAFGAVFPAGNILFGFARTRRLDLLGAIVLGFIAIGTATSLLTGNVLFTLIKESFLTATFGLICLWSLAWQRPLMFYF
ncbi:MAG TPA: VC0807 family protein, partial [Candidatus Binataceae bacterium]|nr:VC0807 family protein [Candidatus Binataceae bacterium]